MLKKSLAAALAVCVLASPAQAAFKVSKQEPKPKAQPSAPPPATRAPKTYRKTRNYTPVVRPLTINGCASDMVCASNPGSVVEGLRQAGYITVLLPSATGAPIIQSSSGGMPWEVHFEDCTNGQNCDVLEFVVGFEALGAKTAKLTNLWNNDNMFGRASATNTRFEIGLSVSTVGGLNKANFADVVARWKAVQGDIIDFFKENPATKYGIKLTSRPK